MAEPLKNMINEENVGKLGQSIQEIYPAFDQTKFMTTIFNEKWHDLALMERGHLITETLGAFLPSEYPLAIEILTKVIENVESFLPVSLTAFIPMFGLDEQYLEISIKALRHFTQFGTSEFAVRPFIEKYEAKMLQVMLEWTQDDNEHVRRLASEGCRPALPWGRALKSYKLDPTPILPILEALKNDDAKYVLKSVANNLNDIAKTHPNLITDLMKDWQNQSKNTDWVIKHGCRTLLKQANPQALALFGYQDATSIHVTDFNVDCRELNIGDFFNFSFNIKADNDTKLRLEYSIDFMKANKKQNKKVFQISEIALTKGQKKSYTKKHSFANLSTRKHYPGAHKITLIVNGSPRDSASFELLED